MFIRETDYCEYIFEWRTPYACPQSTVLSKTCQVTDPLFNHTFDLEPLRNQANDYDIGSDFKLNLCGNLVGRYNGIPQQTSVAKKHDNKFISYGSEQTLSFDSGTISMIFGNGSTCEDGQNASTSILFICSHEEESGPIPLMMNTDCSNTLYWKTKHACPPKTVVDCTLTTYNGDVYDLNDLAYNSFNYVGQLSKGKIYKLNMCRSLVHGTSIRCPYDSASCSVDMNGDYKGVSLGKISTGPIFEDGKLKMRYNQGGKCESNPLKQYSTEVIFECDKTKSHYSFPTFIANEDCKYTFEWSTTHACKVEPEITQVEGNCTTKNSYSDYEFDINSLFKTDSYRIEGENLEMIINSCGSVSEPSCPQNSGACIRKKGESTYKSAGKVSRDLFHASGSLSLQFTDGEPCNNGVPANTIVTFFCGAEDSMKGPFLVSFSEDTCTYYVNWHTELACEYRSECIAKGFDDIFDLRSLIKHDSNYEIDIKTDSIYKKFLINVCRPVNHVAGVNCPAGAAICLIDGDSSKPLSLGQNFMEPMHTAKDKAGLVYHSGDKCEDLPNYKSTSRIEFECDRSAGTVSIILYRYSCYCSSSF